MKLKILIGVFLIIFPLLSGCGGSNVTSNSTDGILSIENVSAPTAAGSQGTVTVKLVAPTGGPGTGVIAITSGNGGLLAFSPASQSVNSGGKATFYCTTTEVENDTVVPFTVSVGSLSLTSQMTIRGTGTLALAVTAPAGTDAAGTITVTFAKGSQAAGRKVTLSTGSASNVALDTTVLSADAHGTAIFSYRVINITADTTITFTATSGAQSVSKSITITPSSINPPAVDNPHVNSIAFVSASPTGISLKGAGGAGRTETSVVTFVVRDVTGQPLAGQVVDFALDTSVGGITLTPAFATSDAAGIVKTIVNAGVVSTPVRVTATVRNKSISSKSDQLIISTGLPHQDGLSIAAKVLYPEAWQYDNVEVPVTAMLSDHFGNPVPDGTSVYFMTYGGSIEASAATKNGIATVNWRSQNPRPADGKAKILVYAIGEESFTDLNGNGLADPGEFTDLPEAFLSKSQTTDLSGKLIRNPLTDPFIDFNGDGIYSTGDGKFNGVLQGAASAGSARSLNVFKNFILTMSGSDAFITAQYPLDSSQTGLAIGAAETSTDIAVSVLDINGNLMPEGTSTTFSFTDACMTANPASANYRTTTATTSIKNTCKGSGASTLLITVTTPKGITTRQSIKISY